MCFKKAVAKSSGFSRIFAFGLMIFSGAGLINLCTVCAETTDELRGTACSPVTYNRYRSRSSGSKCGYE